jgi:hypothetical protein
MNEFHDPRPETSNSRTDESPVFRHLAAISWFFLLCVGYFVNRFIARLGLPSDAQHHTWLGHTRNLVDLFLMGSLQVIIVDLQSRCSRSGFVFLSLRFIMTYLISGIMYTLISGIASIDEAVTEDSEYTWPFLITVAVVGLVVSGVISWHVMHAKRVSRTEFEYLFYIGVRIVLLFALAAAYHIIRSETTPDGPAKLHLHHYFIAWVLSLVALFDHPVSLTFLAITSGVFVQGVSVYSAASMFYRGQNDIPYPEVYMS